MTNAWTPGPWKASETYPPGQFCVHAPSSPWILAYVNQTKSNFPMEANAHLIAAAPRMAEALEAVLPFIDDALDAHTVMSDSVLTDKCRAAVKAANAALAEARGEAP